MEERNYPDKITFKVKFFDEYHDIVIDWNDDKHEHLSDQLFEQIAQITGIPSKYNADINLFTARSIARSYFIPYEIINEQFPPQTGDLSNSRTPWAKDEAEKSRICELFSPPNNPFILIHDRLEFNPLHKNYQITYDLLPETAFPTNGKCITKYCLTKMTLRSFFEKMKSILYNEKINEKTAATYDGSPYSRSSNQMPILKELNLIQFWKCLCHPQNFESWGPNWNRNHGYLRNRG